MSVNSLKQIESFTAFIDFLAAPDKYKELLVEVKKTVAEYEKLLEKYKQFKDVDAYRASIEADKARYEKEISDKLAAIAVERDRMAENAAKQVEVSESRKKALADKADMLKMREDALVYMEEAQKTFEAEKVMHAKRVEEFKVREETARRREEAIKAALR
jgi:hypothetical protein